MAYKTLLGGQIFRFSSVKEVLAKANEEKSGDILAGVAAASDLERIAAKEVLSEMTLKELRENPAVPYESDDVTRLNQDSINEHLYNKIKNWTVSDFREWILSYSTTEQQLRDISRALTSEMVAGTAKIMTNLDLIYGAPKMLQSCSNLSTSPIPLSVSPSNQNRKPTSINWVSVCRNWPKKTRPSPLKPMNNQAKRLSRVWANCTWKSLSTA